MLLGFDIGGTKCAVIIGRKNDSANIDIIDKQIIQTNKPVYEMIDLLFDTADELLKKNGSSATDISGIGISCGGPLSSKKGLILSPPNLHGWDAIPIVELTNKRFNNRSFLQNDANACAVAEWRYGAGRGYNNLVFLTFGTGMGAGLILNGMLYSGIEDLAGEVGHIRLAEMGPVGFGKAGSFEGYCSGGGVAQLAQLKALEKLQMGEKVSYCNSVDDLKNVTAKSVAEAAFQGDETAIAVYEICGKYLGRGLSMIIDLLNPELIILGSIYGRARALIEPYMREMVAKETLFNSNAACKIVPAGLSENIGDMAALSLALISAEEK